MINIEKKCRAGKPKSRLGCKTCKIRRVKCDEAKPSCVRCQKFGIDCDGYISLGAKATNSQATKLLLPKCTDKQPLPFESLVPSACRDDRQLLPKAYYLQGPASPKFQNETEYRYFKVFQDRTATELSGYFDNNVWNRSILQTCHEEFARHAVIAIGALHTTMEILQGRRGDSLPSEARQNLAVSHHESALQHYGKSLQLMRELTQSTTESLLRYTLFSCLLTTCFESYIGNQDNALAQAQIGIAVLTEKEMCQYWNSDDLCAVLRDPCHDQSDLIGTFVRLEAAVLMFNGSRQNPRRLYPLRNPPSAVFTDIPSRFDSLRDARLCWDFSVRRALQWTDSYVQKLNFSTLDFGENDVTENILKADAFAQRIQTELGLYVKVRAKWLRAFQPLFDCSRSKPGSKEYLGASVLMIQYLSGGVTTAAQGQNLEEAHCDMLPRDFTTIVDMAQDCLEWSSLSTTPGKAVFVFDDSLVAGLFLVATRCRDPHLRRRTIHLLQKYPRREGLWDSSMAAKVATWLMDKEEEGMVDGYVPEAARLRIVKTDLKLTERTAIIRCSRLVEETGERVEMPDVTLTW